jgi:hypothetical protein
MTLNVREDFRLRRFGGGVLDRDGKFYPYRTFLTGAGHLYDWMLGDELPSDWIYLHGVWVSLSCVGHPAFATYWLQADYNCERKWVFECVVAPSTGVPQSINVFVPVELLLDRDCRFSDGFVTTPNFGDVGAGTMLGRMTFIYAIIPGVSHVL